LKQEAIRTAEELLEAYPDGPDALNVVARVWYALGNTDTCLDLWERCTRIDPGFPSSYFGMGLVAMEAGEFERAAGLFEKVMSLAPHDSDASSMRGQALMRLGRFEEAVTVLESHVQAREPSPEAMVHLGQGYLKLQRYEEARGIFERVLQRAPDEARAYYGLARVCARLGQKELARRHMEKYQALYSPQLELEIRFAKAYTGPVTAQGRLLLALVEAGGVYRSHGNPAKAEEMWRKAAVVDVRDTRCRLELLSLYEQAGRDRDALKVCQQLLDIEPRNPDHWLNTGLLCGRLEQFDAALAAIEQAIQLAPGNPKYQEAHDLIRRGK
jgi:tetratricopeptide (TPR) repeat protein